MPRSRTTPRKKTPIPGRARKWAKRAGIAAAMGGAMFLGGKKIQPMLERRAARTIAEEQFFVKNELRYSDLVNARKTYEKWKGLRDFDTILVEAAQEFGERFKSIEDYNKKEAGRSYVDPGVNDRFDSLIRLSPEEMKRELDAFYRSNPNVEDRARVEKTLDFMRKDLAAELKKMEARAPERVKGKMRKWYTLLGTGSILATLGLWSAVARVMRKRRLSPAMVSKLKEYDSNQKATLVRKKGLQVKGYRSGDHLITEETRDTFEDGRPFSKIVEVRRYNLNGKLLKVDRR